MRLQELAGSLGEARLLDPGGVGGDLEILRLAYDSRSARPGTLFLCVTGMRQDGHGFAAQAIAHGAAALVVERPLGLGVPELLVPSVRAAMGPLAGRFYGHPAAELEVLGVTGTNGKTTTAYLAAALLAASGRQCGLLGTVKSVIGGQERPVERTTPEAIDLQRDLRAMLDGGDRACAIEVSSHALELGRVAGVPFAAAVFTNLTQDHLDFHPTMEAYFQAKRRLFLPESGPPPRVSVVNVGDPFGRRLAGELDQVRTFALEGPADYSATNLRCEFAGCRFTLRSPDGEREVALPMPGRFNVANALGALAGVHSLGVDLDPLLAALERGVRVPGRFEPVEEGQDFAVLVDYAHTPDSLENVLLAARELTGSGEHGRGRVICVFGAGGDRDRGKRPIMGEIAARLADVTIVTSDNPRSEDPEQIIAEILAGVPGPARAPQAREPLARPSPESERLPGAVARRAQVRSISDRRAAIEQAVRDARANDVLVIAGKGHEHGQELGGGRKVPFDDVAVARHALLAREPSTAAAGLP